MSHVPHINKTHHIHESHDIWMSHVTHINESCHMHESCHIWICDVPHINASCHISESHHIWMRHVTYEWGNINESCSHVNEAGHTCQPCMSHPRVMPRMNESECTYQSVISRASTIRTLRMLPSSFSSFSFESPSYSRYSWELLVYHECRISDLRLLLHHQS